MAAGDEVAETGRRNPRLGDGVWVDLILGNAQRMKSARGPAINSSNPLLSPFTLSFQAAAARFGATPASGTVTAASWRAAMGP